MQIYNAIDRRKEELAQIRPGQIRMYVCGITAYDFCHIGHARSAVVFDTLVRHLRLSGLDTLYIRNFTDIDDKIINRANRENVDWRSLADTYIQAFHEDMDRLGVLRPDLEPRATDYIPQIQQICQTLIDKGLAYATPSGDVYFRARAYKPYGKLSGRNLDELMAGARVEPGQEKEDPLDFALWKAAKPNEPFWDSPWGQGRPGWHIECSAMSQPYLPLDIHGGGQDLLFPHHENEMAQSEAAFDRELAHYWVYNGFVRIDSEKMSKSLGNFKTIRDILKDWLPETLRFFLLNKHYRSPIDFSWQGMQEAEKAQKRVYAALAQAKESIAAGKWKNISLPQDTLQEWHNLELEFKQALNDDLNTALAIGHIFACARLVNRLLEDRKTRNSQQAGVIYEEFLARARQWDAELGLFGQAPEEFLKSLKDMVITRKKIDMEKVNHLLAERAKARADKDFQASDKLREELTGLGILVRDTPAGQEWDIE